MADNIKDLIQKIQEEGVKTAEAKAGQIEERAKKEALALIEKAKVEAVRLISEAEHKADQAETSGKVSLKQAARDLILSLKKEIGLLLNRLLMSEVRQALNPDELAKIIMELIKGYKGEVKGDIIVSLGKEDLGKIEQHFLNKLKEEIKRGIVLKSSEDISSGLIISYDQGKSYFDFTDKAISEYIGAYLNPGLNEILKDVASLDKKI